MGIYGCTVGLLILLAGTAAGQQNLSEASLEELLNTQVTSASKKEEKLSRTPAAVFVINAEDIRRSGATSLPDVLRMAPGVDVQQIDASVWAISIRGFNSRFANKVVVTIDGRSVYTPSFSGVYWDQQTLPLAEIERIEVIRGPGATIWGANTVNGIINILTRSSKEGKKTLVSVTAGSSIQTSNLVETGAGIGTVGAYRAYGQFRRTGDSGPEAFDSWSYTRGGFRSDWELGARDNLLVEGDLFVDRGHALMSSDWLDARAGFITRRNVNSSGGSLLARWDHRANGQGETSVQASYSGYTRNEFGPTEGVREFTLDFQHHIAAGRHDVVWGLAYRASTTSMSEGFSTAFVPPTATEQRYSAFVQDDIRVTHSLSVSLGDRFGHSIQMHSQNQPNIRVAWTPGSGRQMFWVSAAHADREPSRIETSTRIDFQTTQMSPDQVAIVRLTGNPLVQNEELTDFEAGYRGAITRRFTLDVASFASFYSHLSSLEPHQPFIHPGSPVEVITPLVWDNLGHASNFGGELAANWDVLRRWRLRPSYSYLNTEIHPDESSHGWPIAMVAATFPRNQVQLRSMIDIGRRTQFDQTLYYTSPLFGGTIPGHTRLDLRLSRRVGEKVELSLAGQNLLRHRTMEFGDALNLLGAPAMRSAYGRIAWLF